MLIELIRELSHEQKTELYKRHITPQLISDWKKARRLPTEVQVVDLSDVTGADWVDLQKEITVLRAPEERRADIAKALNWRKLSISNRLKLRRQTRKRGFFFERRRNTKRHRLTHRR